MSKLFDKYMEKGSVAVTTDGSGNGTATVTFALAFDRAPEVKVFKPLNDENGHYGAYNSPEMLLYSGKQPMGGISAYAVSSTETKVTQSTVLSAGVIASVADNGDGRSKVTDTTHGLVSGNVVLITGTGSYDGYFAVEVDSANTFIIDRAFVATETGVWVNLNNDLVVADLLTIKGSKNYSGDCEVQSLEAADPVTYWNIDMTYVANDAKGYWVKRPSITVSTFIVQVIGSDVKGGTVNVNWIACERQ